MGSVSHIEADLCGRCIRIRWSELHRPDFRQGKVSAPDTSGFLRRVIHRLLSFCVGGVLAEGAIVSVCDALSLSTLQVFSFAPSVSSLKSSVPPVSGMADTRRSLFADSTTLTQTYTSLKGAGSSPFILATVEMGIPVLPSI